MDTAIRLPRRLELLWLFAGSALGFWSRAEAEAANLGKTRFIAAASHDLLQPLHAARLFTAAMIDRDPGNDLGGKIDASLGAVESLLRIQE